jgi:hypothetical protein
VHIVSDPNLWHAPGGSTSGTGGGDSGEPTIPPSPAEPRGSRAWAPPPKPGLIPLRPLTLATTLAASFQVIRRNPKPTFGLSLVVNAVTYVVFLAVIGTFVGVAVNRVSAASEADQESIIAGSLLSGGLTLLVPLIGSLVVTALLQGVISIEVARGTLGEKLTTRQLLGFARGRIGALIGWSLLIFVVIFLAVLVATVISALLISTGGTTEIVVGIVLVVVFLLGFIALSAWIGTKLSLVPTALLLERLPLRQAIARSWSLTGGYFWRTLGIEWLVAIIIGAATQIVTVPISLIFTLLTTILAPTGDGSVSTAVTIASSVVVGAVSVAISALGVVMQSATYSLIYIDLRMRKEGLDLDLQRFVEARAFGDETVADPYSATSSPTTPRAERAR